MGCESCGERPKHTNKDFTKAVIEINNPETLVLFRKVVIPVSMGDDTEFPPIIGKYYNVLLHYDANGRNYLYSSDGVPTLLEITIPGEIYERIENLEEGLEEETNAREAADATLQNNIDAEILARQGADTTLQNNINTEISARTNADTALQNNITAEATARSNADTALGNRLTTVEGIAGTALQPQSINKVVMTDINLNANTSTATVQIDGTKENILTGATSTKNVPLPVASATQAGVMNSSTYDAVTSNTNNINAIMNGAIAITGISANPSQSDLTTAWQTETGLTTLINRASIYDVTNGKVWTYYTNDTTWHAASNTSQITINTFTNSSEGTILGSTNVGQIFAENDGTGSVNGWDNLSNNVSTNTSNISSLQTAIAGKQDALTPGAGISISAQNVISSTSPAPNDGVLTIQQNGTTLDTFTANSSANKTVNVTAPVITMTTTDPGEGSALAENNYVAVYGGDPIIMDYSTSEINTGAKWIDGSAIYKKTISFGALPNATTKTVAHNIANLDMVIKMEAMAKGSTTNFRPLPMVGAALVDMVRLDIQEGNVRAIDSGDYSAYSAYVTLYYTKSL